MKRYFCCSDIHGFYDIWMDALNEKGFDINNPDHIVILLGDLLDRGDQPRDCLRFICDLIDKNRAICIMGNHEDLMNELLKYKWPNVYDYHNGTKYTIEDLIKDDSLTFQDMCSNVSVDEQWCKYFNECKKHLYYETEHYIFTHSYLPYDSYDFKLFENWRDKNSIRAYYSYWYEEAIWANPFLMWERNGKTYIDDKTLVCGHWNTSWAHREYHGYDKEHLDEIETIWIDSDGVTHPTCCYDIFEDKGIIGLDACTVISKQVNILVLEEL